MTNNDLMTEKELLEAIEQMRNAEPSAVRRAVDRMRWTLGTMLKLHDAQRTTPEQTPAQHPGESWQVKND